MSEKTQTDQSKTSTKGKPRWFVILATLPSMGRPGGL